MSCIHAEPSDPCVTVDTCAIIHDRDEDFGHIEAFDPSSGDSLPPVKLLPSQKINLDELTHLTEVQRAELLEVLDKYPECFSETSGFCTFAEHEIPVTSDFKPRQMKAYKIPERIKPEVERQIQELLRLGFIRPSKSAMASPLVCVMKGKDGKDGVRLAVDYRYVNKYTTGDAYPIPDVADVIQRIGGAQYISTFDSKARYWQTPVREDHRWLTAFICDEGLFEWVRTPFGMKSSGATFVRAVHQVLKPLKVFTDSYIDDMSAHDSSFT